MTSEPIITITEQETALSLIINPGNTYTFDPAGRLVGIYQEKRYYARGLNGEFKEKSWEGAKDEFDRHIKPVPMEFKIRLIERLNKDLGEVRLEVVNGHKIILHTNEPTPDHINACLRIIDCIQQKTHHLAHEEKAFHSLYKPITILPPDQYFTIVLQVTEGCPWNKCTYCDFFRDRKFLIRSLKEIESHVKAVAEFLGEGSKLRRSIFLGDANSFAIPDRAMLGILGEIKKVFPMQTEEGGIFTFGDVPAILGKTKHTIQALKNLGLRRVYIGMESGSNSVRKLINKPGTKGELLRAVSKLKDAGMGVGLILMLGIGGREMEEKHLKGIIECLKSAPLDKDDIVFCSPFFPDEHMEYAAIARKKGLTPVDKTGLRAQYKQIKDAVLSRPRSPRIGVYDIREFVY